MSSDNTLPLVGNDVYVFRRDRARHFQKPKTIAKEEIPSLYKVQPKFTIRKRFNSEGRTTFDLSPYSPQRKNLTPIKRSNLQKSHLQDFKRTLLVNSSIKTQGATLQTTIDSKRSAANSGLKTLPHQQKQQLAIHSLQSSNQQLRKNYLKALKSPRHRSEHSNKKVSPQPRPNEDGFPISAQICVMKYKDILTMIEKDQIKMLHTVYYLGKRRPKIGGVAAGFDDQHGDLKVYAKDQIGYRYEIIDILGKGSFGQVFKAYDHKTKEQIALKIIKNQSKYTNQAMIQAKLLYQIRSIDPNCHYNIIKVKQSFMFRSHMCLTFQLLHMNLYDFLKLHKFKGFSLQLIHRFAIQILQSLLLLYRHNIIHCDLKPQNIMLRHQSKSGIRVIDLGSSCLRNEIMFTYIQSRYYRAPEIILGIDYTPAIDMWSFGCILCQLFTGSPIFPGESQTQQIGLFVQLRGKPPKSLLEKAKRKKFFDQTGQLKNVQDSNGKLYTPSSKTLEQELGSSNKQFIDLVSKCFEWEPSKRIKPAQALIHPWILELLPSEVRIRHMDQMRNEAPYLFSA